MAENEIQVADPPTDGITALRFSPDGAGLLASSWDATLRLYDLHASAALRCLHSACRALSWTAISWAMAPLR